jgi:hypothetical protein
MYKNQFCRGNSCSTFPVFVKSIKSDPQKMTWGGWVPPFCRAKSDFWGPRPLQNEEPATIVARHLLYKIRVSNPLFLVYICDFPNHWPLQSGEPGISAHVSRMVISNKKPSNKMKTHVPLFFFTKWEPAKPI